MTKKIKFRCGLKQLLHMPYGIGMGLMSLMGELLRHKLRRSINRGVKIPVK